MTNWNRAKTYHHYMSEVPCTYSMCVNLDISILIATVKRQGLKLFPAYLYGISRIVNRHQEFRMAIDAQNHLGFFDVSHPCYAVFHEESESFSNIWTEYNEDFNLFYQNYENDMELYGKEGSLISKPISGDNLFNVSCIPWTSFTGFNINLQKGYDYLPPIFTVGKYSEENNKTLMPLAIQVHHAVCDGFHAARFVNELQTWMNNFSL